MGLPATSHGAAVLRAALGYAARGWQIVPLHGIAPDGSCTCGDHHTGREGTRGKHPVVGRWQHEATTDEERIQEWVESRPLGNIGVSLGEASGIIDVEADSSEGEVTLGRLCHGLVTPTYRSGRSVHRLLRWSQHLPATAVVKIAGVEFRLGGGGRGAQSVLPPSRHWGGQSYEWLPGMSPDECDPAEIPDALLALLSTGEESLGSGGTAFGPGGGSPILPNGGTRARQALILETIGDGERNSTLHAFACRLAYQSQDITHPRNQADLHEMVACLNAAKCRPPLEADEVAAIVDSAIRYAMRQPTSGTAETLRARPPAESHEGREEAAPASADAGATEESGDAAEACDATPAAVAAQGGAKAAAARPVTLAGHGLVCVGGQWTPGAWSLEAVRSDPATYRLIVPAWKPWTPGGDGVVLLGVREMDDAGRMAECVLSTTRVISLNFGPRVWASIWNGSKGQYPLSQMLLSTAVEVDAPPIDLGLAPAAETLWEACLRAETHEHPHDVAPGQVAKIIDPDGGACYWLRWREFWRRPVEQGRVGAADAADLARRIGLGHGGVGWRKRRDAEGVARQYAVIDPARWSRLESMVD